MDYIYEYDSSGNEIVNITYYKRDESGSAEYLLKYQAAEGNYISITYNQDGAVKCIEEFNSTTRKLVKYMIYNSNGKVSFQYQTEDGKYISVKNNSDGSVDYIDEYDISTGKVVKRIGYRSGGTVYYIDEYDTSTGIIVKKTFYEPDGSVSSYKIYKHYSSGYEIYRYRSDDTKESILEYVLLSDSSNYKLIKTTYYNPDGSIRLVENY